MYITATQIHNGRAWLPQGTTLCVNDDGLITEILTAPPAGTVLYEGVLAPGFVNVHCHMELSHMLGVVPEHTGLIPFLKTIPQHRNDHTSEQKTAARATAYAAMVVNGIVAVGDIANTTDTLDIRANTGLYIHTFIEALGFSDANAARSFGYAINSYDAFAAQSAGQLHLSQSITPHAPYSVSRSLFGLISGHTPGSLISIHNQESTAENEFFQQKTGGIRDLLGSLGIDDSLFQPTELTSLQSYLPWLSHARPIIFVHNTYTSHADVLFAKALLRRAYWCLCPNANMYIENRLPDVNTLVAEDVDICIGTDSLASNHQLSILSELQTLKQYYPHLTWETLLCWATANGAAALQLSDTFGTLAPGRRPGILHLTGLDTQQPSVSRVI